MDLDRLLKTVVDSDASDLILKVGTQPAMKVHGKVLFIGSDPLTPEELDQVFVRIATPDVKARMVEHGERDFSCEIEGVGRFRCNAFRQLGSYAVVVRQVKRSVPSSTALFLPERQCNHFAALARGLIL